MIRKYGLLFLVLGLTLLIAVFYDFVDEHFGLRATAIASMVLVALTVFLMAKVFPRPGSLKVVAISGTTFAVTFLTLIWLGMGGGADTIEQDLRNLLAMMLFVAAIGSGGWFIYAMVMSKRYAEWETAGQRVVSAVLAETEQNR